MSCRDVQQLSAANEGQMQPGSTDISSVNLIATDTFADAEHCDIPTASDTPGATVPELQGEVHGACFTYIDHKIYSLLGHVENKLTHDELTASSCMIGLCIKSHGCTAARHVYL